MPLPTGRFDRADRQRILASSTIEHAELTPEQTPPKTEDRAALLHRRFAPRRLIRHAATWLALAGVGLAIGAPFLLNAHVVLTGVLQVPLRVFFALAASAIISAAAKAGKLQLLQTQLGIRLRYGHTLAITLVSDFAFLVSPLGAAGYGVNIALLRRTGASWASAATVVGADQALDLTFFALAVPIALALALGPLARILPPISEPRIETVLLGALALLCVLWVGRRQLASVLSRTIHRFASLDSWLGSWLNSRRSHWRRFHLNMTRQIASLAAAGCARFIALLLLTTLQWLLRYGALWFALLELGCRLSPAFVLAVQAVVLHVALWTGVPAGGGGGDLALAAAFAPWVPRAVMAIALVLWRFATLYCPLMAGAAGFAALAWRRRVHRLARHT
ncbi:flippase-like domain-containing protein [Burkholderia sp. L27(2015)]|uniref:flippase-like domain-containing protein n=1 Tax=Burkholderia sp. L27(2015) TaxID=1641858 RepID=UPI00131A73B5|nr:flippase-like domain-containing protein [Burkholderia sp. L27(2015)]